MKVLAATVKWKRLINKYLKFPKRKSFLKGPTANVFSGICGICVSLLLF